MIEYKKEFLDIMKVLLSYLIEFNKKKSILLKKYLKNYVVGGLNQRLIMRIIYNKNTFSVNNSYQKV